MYAAAKYNSSIVLMHAKLEISKERTDDCFLTFRKRVKNVQENVRLIIKLKQNILVSVYIDIIRSIWEKKVYRYELTTSAAIFISRRNGSSTVTKSRTRTSF